VKYVTMRALAVFFLIAAGAGASRADDGFGVNLLRPDCLAGWDYADPPPAGWTIADGRLSGTADSRIWDGKNNTTLLLLRRRADGAEKAGSVVIPHQGTASLDSLRVELAAGQQFTLLPKIEGMFAGGTCRLLDLRVTLGDLAPADGGVVYRLPAAWEGTKVGSTDGNPITADGRPIWRLDRVYPDKHIMAENYAPLPWNGTVWHPEDHQQGGQPKARVENASALLSVAGPWTNYEYQKICGLVFIPPESGVYQVRGTASTKPWSGRAEVFRLAVLKKDTQRAAEVISFELPRDASPVKMDFQVELTEGHELVFLPLMPHWNNATATRVADLEIRLME